MKTSTASELRSIRKGLDKLREEVRAMLAAQAAGAPQAVKRSVAAKLMGMSPSKLDGRIARGKVRTCEDVTLVPMSEVKRYTAPKAPRRSNARRPRVVLDMTSPEAIAAMKRELRQKRAAGGAP